MLVLYVALPILSQHYYAPPQWFFGKMFPSCSNKEWGTTHSRVVWTKNERQLGQLGLVDLLMGIGSGTSLRLCAIPCVALGMLEPWSECCDQRVLKLILASTHSFYFGNQQLRMGPISSGRTQPVNTPTMDLIGTRLWAEPKVWRVVPSSNALPTRETRGNGTNLHQERSVPSRKPTRVAFVSTTSKRPRALVASRRIDPSRERTPFRFAYFVPKPKRVRTLTILYYYIISLGT